MVTPAQHLPASIGQAMVSAIRLLRSRTGWSYEALGRQIGYAVRRTLASAAERSSAGLYPRSTVRYWAKTGRLPELERAAVETLFAKHDVHLQTSDRPPGSIELERGRRPFTIEQLASIEEESDFAQQMLTERRDRLSVDIVAWLKSANQLSDADRDIVSRVLLRLAGQHNTYADSFENHRAARHLLDVALELNPPLETVSRILHESGLTYQNLREPSLAKKALSTALRAARVAGSPELESAIATDRSRLIATTESNGGALGLARGAVELARRADSARSLFASNLATSLALVAREEPDGAIAALDGALEPFQGPDDSRIPSLWRYLWRVHRALAMSAARDISAAAAELDAALAVASEAGVAVWVRNGHKLAALIDQPRKMRRQYCQSP